MGIHYMFIWDNCSWKRTWSGLEGNDWAPQFDDTKEHPASESGILAELRYGDKSEWEKHFYYLLPFFKDSRYITWNGEPIFAVMLPGNNFSLLEKMFSYWNELAKDNNLPGVKCLSLDTFSNRMKGHLFQSSFRYAPFQQYSLGAYLTERRKRKKAKREELTRFYEYSQLWEYILKQAKRSESNTILSGFVTYDDTPRRGKMAQIVRDATPLQFERYLTELLFISQQQKKPYLFLSAWNEWGEGMYLEPDTEYKYEWLEAVRNALIKVNGDI